MQQTAKMYSICINHTHTHTNTMKQIDRQTDRYIDRQIKKKDRASHRQHNRKRDVQMNGQVDPRTDTHTCVFVFLCMRMYTQIDTDRNREWQRGGGDSPRLCDFYKHKQTDRQSERERDLLPTFSPIHQPGSELTNPLILLNSRPTKSD